MNLENDDKGASVKFPPPLIFLFLILATYGVHYIWPIDIGSSSVLKYLGVAVSILGLGAIFIISQYFKRDETNIEPWKPTTKIISTGIFAYSRNPIYVAFCLITIGTGIFLNSFWVLCSVIPSAVLVYYVAIKKEEAYLEEKFGEEYLRYKSKVRRWL